jgi:hypothetical protein
MAIGARPTTGRSWPVPLKTPHSEVILIASEGGEQNTQSTVVANR